MFSPVRLEGWLSRAAPSRLATRAQAGSPAYAGRACRFASALRAPRGLNGCPARVGPPIHCAPPWRVISSAPGPSLSPGYSVPNRHHLFGPIRPTRGHIAYFTAWRLIRDAFAVRERLSDPRVVPGFRYSFRPDMPPSLTPESSIVVSVQNTDVDIGLRHGPTGSALPRFPQSVSRGDWLFGASLVRNLLRPVRLLAPLYGSDRFPGQRGFYIQAFSGSVALPAAGYDYNSVWTPLLAGLSPAGMAASLAALDQIRAGRVRGCVRHLYCGRAACRHQVELCATGRQRPPVDRISEAISRTLLLRSARRPIPRIRRRRRRRSKTAGHPL